jgi:hypothetical protein
MVVLCRQNRVNTKILYGLMTHYEKLVHGSPLLSHNWCLQINNLGGNRVKLPELCSSKGVFQIVLRTNRFFTGSSTTATKPGFVVIGKFEI